MSEPHKKTVTAKSFNSLSQDTDMRTKQLLTILCLLAALTSMQPALAQDSKIETAIPKEAAAAIEAGNWAEVATILKPLATAPNAAPVNRIAEGVSYPITNEIGMANSGTNAITIEIIPAGKCAVAV